MVPGAPQKEATPALSWADPIQKDELDRDENAFMACVGRHEA
jgi:hypothetical protein